MAINAAEFRTKCFKILDQVQATHQEVVITKRGRRIAKIVHIETEDANDPLIGALMGAGHALDDLTQPVVDPQEWELD